MKEKCSRALTYLRALRAAIPASANMGEVSSMMNEGMRIALRNRFEFHIDDGAALQRLSYITNAGVFHPFGEGFYALACLTGGTYARLWEKHVCRRPWKAPLVLKGIQGDMAGQPMLSTLETLAENRIAPGMVLLMPPTFQQELKNVYSLSPSLRVWRCTSFDNETLVLTAYDNMRAYDTKLQALGRPSHIRRFTRESWAQALQSLQVDANSEKTE